MVGAVSRDRPPPIVPTRPQPVDQLLVVSLTVLGSLGFVPMKVHPVDVRVGAAAGQLDQRLRTLVGRDGPDVAQRRAIQESDDRRVTTETRRRGTGMYCGGDDPVVTPALGDATGEQDVHQLRGAVTAQADGASASVVQIGEIDVTRQVADAGGVDHQAGARRRQPIAEQVGEQKRCEMVDLEVGFVPSGVGCRGSKVPPALLSNTSMWSVCSRILSASRRTSSSSA